MSQLITQDQRMGELIQLAKTVASSKATVLIQGESGTGKEGLAKLIHESSSRASRPFVAINCAAIPDNLLESELFGHERGAFTGAVGAKAGKFELANGGTLLLDEISEMDIRLQAKLLRVLQEGEVDRIGSRKPSPVDVRIVATTNRNLADEVRAGRFREDLFYRLNVVNLTIPALKDRIGDVKILTEHFLGIYGSRNAVAVNQISDRALELLNSHIFPGNVRELENLVERAVITAHDGLITEKDIQIPRPSQSAVNAAMAGSGGWQPGRTLIQIEQQVILDALQYHSGNRTHTAKALGISIRTLRNKLAEFREMGIHV